MNHKLVSAIESHPVLGWLASFGSIFLGGVSWLIDHADDFAKILGVGAAIFGLVAGYYTMRIQHRAWKQGNRRH